ncbi:G2/mitotic-specific cyclin-B-like isoform X2 [Dendronephthya gigantea]|uniref:G2/mitotic-specific cyclin-B-like isoform X2 n=1 Tax=Dendronephthya gigantea TaxID=151771 RepID=UPI00106DC6F8|nr:G2/mitotic-specific cyclin-B-like isoform X2 [Dendronephthya gigantea]
MSKTQITTVHGNSIPAAGLKVKDDGGKQARRIRNALGTITNISRVPIVQKTKKTLSKVPSTKTTLARKEAVSKESLQCETESVGLKALALEKIDYKDVVDIDAEDMDNPFCCSEYAEEIYRYLKKREEIYQVPENYIQSHKEINVKMRAILVDWLISVHEKFKLTQETLFLAISILDRYLAVSHTEKKTNLQLIGVTAMFLASKIEDIYAPDILDLAYVTDYSCSSDMIKSYEKKMSTQLGFNFGDPLCINFLRRNSKALKATAEQHALAKFFMELMLLDYECCVTFPPSQRAATALYVAMKITDNSSWVISF